ncbi:uncharacterized protein EAF01_004725 [Botrytis porri]|uniref:uncharacterized protein n=1 Tax=Botrytis porri TaxID=87229 RepID=UPI00190081B4|nr:uncharacterized protein EAF01_004725 [Botrytis porri]KAF7907138.1 hypothetical protein EAF01_004725 [Botrytis porri]
MVDGDNIIAGSGGAALSGGQKLRIALARAVYSRHRILMLDHVFSGLDIVGEEQIFTRLIGRHGLLRQLGITTILLTHAAHPLSYADHIIALNVHDTSKESKSVDVKNNNDTARQIASVDLERPIGNWATYQYNFESLEYGNLDGGHDLLFFTLAVS